jgi:tetratricopeptide (TPR) repeat protein
VTDRRSAAAELFRQAFQLHQQGNLAQAEQLYLAVLQSDPNSSDAHLNLGAALVQLNRLEEAVGHFEKAVVLKPDSWMARSSLGNALAQLKRPDRSIQQFEKALELTRHNAEPYLRACYNIGVSLQELDRHAEAIPHYARAIAIRPDYAEAHNNLGDALVKCGRPEEALPHFETSAAIRPSLAEAHNNLGIALDALNRVVEAVPHFRRALAMKPDYAEAHANLGLLLESLGQGEEATQAFEKAIKCGPTVPKFYRMLFSSKRAVSGDRHVAAMIDLAKNAASLPRGEQIELHFGLGKVFADLKEYDRSFGHFLEGNVLKRQEVDYDEDATLGALDDIRTTFTSDLMLSKRGLGVRSTGPIFIVGMPRSGSTLVEQILASHPLVFAAGELDHFQRAVTLLAGREGSHTRLADQMRKIADEDLVRLSALYLRDIRNIAPSAQRVTDKMPSNFRFVGLIHLALPNARIIHTRRDPVDTCVSCFSTLFARGHPFAFELSELGRYYRAYERLMDHWRALLPEAVMIDVRYEDLIADFETQARRILAHCGLEWDEGCLAFHKAKRAVKTASAGQVHQPLYSFSVGRGSWYGDMLRPLLDVLS